MGIFLVPRLKLGFGRGHDEASDVYEKVRVLPPKFSWLKSQDWRTIAMLFTTTQLSARKFKEVQVSS